MYTGIDFSQIQLALRDNSANYNAFKEEDFIFAKEQYQQGHRTYHGFGHAAFIGSGLPIELVEALENIQKEPSARKGRAPNTSELRCYVRDVQLVAAFFHDLIQIHIDNGTMPTDYVEFLSEFVDIGNDQGTPTARVKNIDVDKHPYAKMVKQIFKVEAGDKVVHGTGSGGLNEFLSALILAKIMDVVGADKGYAIDVISAMYATIPFTSQEQFTALKDRIKSTFEAHNVSASGGDIKCSMIIATDIANKDISSFHAPFHTFIADAMSLIPELNAELRDPDNVTPENYMNAMEKMRDFYRMLDDPDFPYLKKEDIIHECEGYPPKENFAKMRTQIDSNLVRGMEFFEAKVVSTGMVTAIATLIQEPDMQLSNLVDGTSSLIKTKLEGEEPQDGQVNNSVLNAMKGKGQTLLEGFDVPESPFGKLIYERIGKDKVSEIYNSMKTEQDDGKFVLKDFRDPKNAKELLTSISEDIGAENFNNVILSSLERIAKNGDNKGRAEKLHRVSAEIDVDSPAP